MHEHIANTLRPSEYIWLSHLMSTDLSESFFLLDLLLRWCQSQGQELTFQNSRLQTDSFPPGSWFRLDSETPAPSRPGGEELRAFLQLSSLPCYVDLIMSFDLSIWNTLITTVWRLLLNKALAAPLFPVPPPDTPSVFYVSLMNVVLLLLNPLLLEDNGWRWIELKQYNWSTWSHAVGSLVPPVIQVVMWSAGHNKVAILNTL